MPADFGQVEGICDEFASAGVRFEGKVGLNCGQRGEAKVQRQIVMSMSGFHTSSGS